MSIQWYPWLLQSIIAGSVTKKILCRTDNLIAILWITWSWDILMAQMYISDGEGKVPHLFTKYLCSNLVLTKVMPVWILCRTDEIERYFQNQFWGLSETTLIYDSCSRFDFFGLRYHFTWCQNGFNSFLSYSYTQTMFVSMTYFMSDGLCRTDSFSLSHIFSLQLRYHIFPVKMSR